MAEVECLTDEQLAALRVLAEEAGDRGQLLTRVLRIVESQRAALKGIRRLLETPRDVDSPEAHLSRELWAILGSS